MDAQARLAERTDDEVRHLWLNHKALVRRNNLTRPMRARIEEAMPLLKAECERRGISLLGWRAYPGENRLRDEILGPARVRMTRTAGETMAALMDEIGSSMSAN